MSEDNKPIEESLQNLVTLRNQLKDQLGKTFELLKDVEGAISTVNRQEIVDESTDRGKGNFGIKPAGKVSTGTKKLDDLLSGGFPEPSNILLNGPPYCSKYSVANNFISSSILDGYPVIVVSLDRDVTRIKQDLFGISDSVEKYENSGMLKFVDAYSKVIQSESTDKNATVVEGVTNTSNFLRTVDSISASTKANSGPYRMVVFSLTGWITQTEEKTFSKAFQHFSQRRRIEGAVTLYTIEDGIFQRSLYENVNYFMDGSIEFRSEISTEYLRVRGLKDTRSRDWVEVFSDGDKIDLGSFDLKRIR
ncbi:MAG: RAD55 family ATPase [Candidatus Thermoplasmatota archaeon]|nr:RAD55 family ATPase [Candidatus Thermoplasmatota archaeon]MDA8143376.1 RAD55 family ATPase [Thermoplasmatales archaeon]